MLDSLNTPESRKLIALDLAKGVQDAIDNDDLDAAADKIQQLQEHINGWQQTERAKQAKAWLDTALAGDVLTFNGQQAKQKLQTWRDVTGEETTAEIETYQERVDEQIRRKQENIQVRGVIAHCEELFEQAKKLESGDAPPKPQLVLDNYYSKALNIASAAYEETPNSPELDVLQRKAKRLHDQKQTAATIYPSALEDDKYTVALAELGKLPADMRIPRFTVAEGSTPRRATFSNMVSTDAAQTEIRERARAWAQRTLERKIQEAQAALDAHNPQQAVDTLETTDRLDNLLTNEMLTRLSDIRQRAAVTLQSKERAEELAQEAADEATEDDLGAWEKYTRAKALYEQIDTDGEHRAVILKAMHQSLQEQIDQADRAFHQERDMERVRALHKQAQTAYAYADDSLDEYLQQLADFNEMTNQYDEYLETARSLLQQVRDALWNDTATANDILSQLESYPDIVLEEFPDLYDVRQQVNRRIAANTRYSGLYRGLYAQTIEDARAIMEQIETAAEDFPDDDRFPTLSDRLNLHLYFLTAQQKLSEGDIAGALESLRAVASVEGHPDQQRARELIQQHSNA